MKAIALVLFFCGFAAVAQAETLIFENSDYQAEWTWLQGPQTPDESVAQIRWLNSQGEPVDLDDSFTVSLWMPDMGHGSAPTEWTHISQGLYRVTGMYFTMSGKWWLQVKLKSRAGVEEVQTLEVELGGDGHHHLHH